MSKRRPRPGSSRPKRKTNPLKIVLTTGGVLLIAMVVVLLVGKMRLDSWMKGDGFRDFIAGKSAAILKSDVMLGATKWEGSQVYAENFSVRGFEDAPFAKMDLGSIRAINGGARKGAFRIPEIKVNRMNLDFSPVRKKGRYPVAENTSTDSGALPAWLLSRLPNRVEIDEILIDTGNLTVSNAVGEELISLKSVRTVVMPDFETKTWEIKGAGGKLHISNQPEMKIKDMALRWKAGSLFLNQFALKIFDEGHIDGLGEIDFEQKPAKLDLDLKLSRIDLHDLIKDKQWQDRVSGTLRGPIRVTGHPGKLRQEGTIYLDEGLLTALPILDTIASYTRSDRFKRLGLNEAHSDFVREGDRIELRNLVVQSDGLLRLEGKVDITGNQLRGNLRVGVVPGTLRWIPGAEQSVFTESKDGFLWAGMKLTGTTAKPEEDLSGRLIIAAGEAILTDLPGNALNQAKQILGGKDGKPGAENGAAKNKAGEVIDQGKKIINLLTPILIGQ